MHIAGFILFFFRARAPSRHVNSVCEFCRKTLEMKIESETVLVSQLSFGKKKRMLLFLFFPYPEEELWRGLELGDKSCFSALDLYDIGRTVAESPGYFARLMVLACCSSGMSPNDDSADFSWPLVRLSSFVSTTCT